MNRRNRAPQRRRIGSAAIAAAALCGASATAVLVDLEPANDDPGNSPTVVERTPVLATDAGAFALDATPACVALDGCDVDFVRLTGLRAGDFVAAYTSGHPALGAAAPELAIGLLDGDGVPLALGSATGASARLGFVVAEDGDAAIGVSGRFDDAFVGDHFEAGPYHLSLAVFPAALAGATLADIEPANDQRESTPVAIARADATAVFAGAFTLGTPPGCSSAGGVCDLDFVRIDGLLAGDLVTVATFLVGAPGESEATTPDTRIGIFDGGGTLVAVEDDFEPASLFDFEVSAPGSHWIAVTGTFDIAFAGDHSQFGPYQLAVTIHPAPELSRAVAGAAAVVVLLGSSRRRRIR
jgi:hypothetical protein